MMRWYLYKIISAYMYYSYSCKLLNHSKLRSKMMFVRTLNVSTYTVHIQMSSSFSFIWSIYKGIAQNKTYYINQLHSCLTVRVQKIWRVKHFRENCPIKILCIVLAMYICAKVVNNEMPCLLAHSHNQGYVHTYIAYFIITYCYS